MLKRQKGKHLFGWQLQLHTVPTYIQFWIHALVFPSISLLKKYECVNQYISSMNEC